MKKLRRYLTKSNCLKLVNALVFSHLDYCNSLLINLPKNTIRPFQRIQNFAAKMAAGKSKFSSATEALKELHILPIPVRCEFKILMMVYKSLHGLAPIYLTSLLKPQSFAYKTRSSDQNMLVVPFTKRTTFVNRSFSVAGPKLWNNLPTHIKNSESLDHFKKNLKTYPFKRTFESL